MQIIYQQLFLSTSVPKQRRITNKMVRGTIWYQILFLFSFDKIWYKLIQIILQQLFFEYFGNKTKKNYH